MAHNNQHNIMDIILQSTMYNNNIETTILVDIQPHRDNTLIISVGG